MSLLKSRGIQCLISGHRGIIAQNWLTLVKFVPSKIAMGSGHTYLHHFCARKELPN